MQTTISKIASLPDKEFCKYIETESLCLLHKIKLYTDDIYYNTGKSSGLTDWRYDYIKETLNKRDPNYIVPTGTRIREYENRTELPFWLGSMDKKKDEKEISKWISCNKTKQFLIEDKLDGVSCLISIKSGKVKIFTRGDGKIGADISYLSQYIRNIPKNLKLTIFLRGELIINYKLFKEKYSNEYANPRNLVSGLVGSKTIKEGLEDIDFIAYEIISDEVADIPSVQLDFLDKLGFKTVNRQLVENVSVESLTEILVRNKEISDYEIDGLIVHANFKYERNTTGNPTYAFAFKMRFEDNLIEANVLRVEWNVSKWGTLKPRVEIQPVQLGGVTITWASGFNAKFIVDKCIGPEAIIEITRSGDVIPYIVRVVKKAKQPDMPQISWSWNETKVDIQTDDYSDTSNVKKIANFFAELGIKHVGEKNVQKMYESGLDSLFKIISASEDDFEKVPGFGKKLAERTFVNIHDGLKDLSLPLVLGAYGLFGFGIGVKKLTTLFETFPDILDVYKTMKNEDIIVRILQIEGFSDKSAKKVVDNLEDAKQFIIDIKKCATFKEKTVKTQIENKLQDMKIVLSGFRDKKLEESIVLRGGKVTTSVSKQTSLLVVSSKSEKSSGKVAKALEIGVNVIDREEFLSKFI
jgi:NAD-dependent DNA ligase